MAITMSDAKITNDRESNLLGKSVDSGVLSGGAELKTSGWGPFTSTSGKTLAGVTFEFASAVSQEIESYTSNINSILDTMENVGSEVAFKGTQIKPALTNFITGIKEVSQAYLHSLQEAEKEIVNSVRNVYVDQDINISDSMKSDTNTVTSSKPVE